MANKSFDENSPQQPKHLSEYAKACLKALDDAQLGRFISIGVGLGLLHYLDYRSTHDVDAWWISGANEENKTKVLDKIQETLNQYGQVVINKWGDVSSIELQKGGETIFSFQIAQRSAQLESPHSPDWTRVPVDDLKDIIASKMVALVERGAPRDFRDIHKACKKGLITADRCWKLWRKRQELGGSDTNMERAKLAVETHLQRIETQRPLEGIEDEEIKEEAIEVREWFKEVFLQNE